MKTVVRSAVRLTVVASIALCVGGCATSRDWENARATDTQDAYRAFVQNHPETPQAEFAKTRIAELKSDADWEKARATNTPEAYGLFLSAHPRARQVIQAQELQAWLTAEKANTTSAYALFLERFPQSKQNQAARTAIRQLEEEKEWGDATTANTVVSLTRFLDKYPRSKHADEARSLRDAVAEATAWQSASSANTDAALVDFITTYPNSKNLADAIKKLRHYTLLGEGDLIPWAAIGGKTMTVNRNGYTATMFMNDNSGLNSSNWSELNNGVLYYGAIQASPEGFHVQKGGRALLPTKP